MSGHPELSGVCVSAAGSEVYVNSVGGEKELGLYDTAKAEVTES
jgi:hypothetical protein